MDRKFSVIIPTLFSCISITKHLIDSLCQDPSVSEIILIDNTNKSDNISADRIFPNEKVKVYSQGKNIYVNPSWNLGVKLAKEENIALLNDDMVIPDYLFNILTQLDFKNIGILGACHPYIEEVDVFTRYAVDKVEAMPMKERIWGYGIFMAMHKSHYIPIPEDMLIWCGDDYLFHQNILAGRNNYTLLCPIHTKMSVTSNNPIFDNIKENDVVVYNKKYKV
jgi:hypothetical protein